MGCSASKKTHTLEDNSVSYRTFTQSVRQSASWRNLNSYRESIGDIFQRASSSLGSIALSQKSSCSVNSNASSNMPSDRFEADPTDITRLYSDHTTTCRRSRWKSSVEAIVEIANDGGIPPESNADMLELRLFLDEPYLLKKLLEVTMNSSHKKEIICWMDIQFFKAVDSYGIEHRICTAMCIIDKYIRLGTKHCLAMDNIENTRFRMEQVIYM